MTSVSCGIDSVALSGLGCSWLETRGGALRACPWLPYAAPAALILCSRDALTVGRETVLGTILTLLLIPDIREVSGLAELVGSPEAAEEFDLQGRPLRFGWEDDADNIKAIRRFGEFKHPAVSMGSTSYLALLAQIHIGRRRRKPSGGAGFHFYKTKDSSFIGDNINLSVNDRVIPIPTNRNEEVRRDDLKPKLGQISHSKFLAAKSELACRSLGFL